MNCIKSCAKKCSLTAISAIIIFTCITNTCISAQSLSEPVAVGTLDEMTPAGDDMLSLCDISNIIEQNEEEKSTIIEMTGEKTLISGISEIPSYDMAQGSLSNYVLNPDISVDMPLESHEYSVGSALTDEELQLLYYVVDTEVVSGSVQHKIIITQVIFNRVKSSRFPNTVKEVLLSPNQFSTAPLYYSDKSRVFSEKTITAVNSVLNNQTDDLSKGALYFCSHSVVSESSWFENALTPLFDMEGHRFYTY